MSKDPSNSRQHHIGWQLQQAARDFNARALVKLRERGHTHLTATHLNLLPYLDAEGTRINTLAERVILTKQAVSQTVTELEKYGYVSRLPDPSDGRAVLVTFTERGQTFLQDAAVIKREIADEYRHKLGGGAFEKLSASLQKLLTTE